MDVDELMGDEQVNELGLGTKGTRIPPGTKADGSWACSTGGRGLGVFVRLFVRLLVALPVALPPFNGDGLL